MTCQGPSLEGGLRDWEAGCSLGTEQKKAEYEAVEETMVVD